MGEVVKECVGERLEPGQVTGCDPVGGWSDVSFGSATDRIDTRVGGDAIEPGAQGGVSLKLLAGRTPARPAT